MRKLELNAPSQELELNNASCELASEKLTVDLNEIKQLSNVWNDRCSSIECRFKLDKDSQALVCKIVIESTIRNGKKITRKFESYADLDLVETITNAMTGNVSVFDTYVKSEHDALVQNEQENLIHEIFKQYLDSSFSMVQENSLRTQKNDVYYCFTFHVGYNRNIKFCIKQDVEIDKMLSTMDEELI